LARTNASRIDGIFLHRHTSKIRIIKMLPKAFLLAMILLFLRKEARLLYVKV
jgi:hypothetical protein